MKFVSATLSLFLAANAADGAFTCDYTPTEDVVDHSKSAVDVSQMTDLLKAGDNAGALALYVDGANRESATLETTAQKDWAASGAPDDIYQDYVSVLGEDFLDGYNKDATSCNGQFEGESADLCEVAAAKNIICTTLLYAQYEFSKSGGEQGSEKNWDEGFAFWNGLFQEEVAGVGLGKSSAGAVQDSRDGNFGTSFKETTCSGIKAGQSQNMEDKNEAFNTIAKGLVGTFASATLKYSAEMLQEAEQSGQDRKWAEGYTYFRCGAGLMDSDLAAFIESTYNPLNNDYPSDNSMHCNMIKQMMATDDIGYGITFDDLMIDSFENTMGFKEFCGLEGSETPESSSSTANIIAAALGIVAGALLL